ncbi:MAG: plasmid mobilization relaxosome protein MobC [Magnetospirillum sp.]|nr:plasmid mobilization relaxosome protein MobC [Magnetospirillum sp.]
MAALSTDKRLTVVSFRLTDGEAARIDAAAALMGRTRCDWARAAALHVAKLKVPEPPPPRRHPARRMPKADVRLLAEVLGQLGKIGSNVNQLARRMNKGGPAPDSTILAAMDITIKQAAADIRRALEGRGDGDQGE